MMIAKFLKAKFRVIAKNAISFILLSFLFFSLTQFVAPQDVQAGSWWDTAKSGGVEDIGKSAFGISSASDKKNDVRVITANIIKVFLELLGIIFVVILVLAGFKWMTAEGNDDKVKEAKDGIIRALIGLVIVFTAYALAHLIFNKIIFVTTGSEPVW